MHHDHDDAAKAQPMTAVGSLEYKLDNLAGVEVAPDEFWVRLVLFEAHDADVVCGHDGTADGSDALKEVLREGSGRAREGLDEDDVGVRELAFGVEALDADGHLGG